MTTTTTTTMINRSMRTVTVIESAIGPRFAAHLVAQGFDGKAYLGSAPSDGRKRRVEVLLYRCAATGKFVNALS